MCDVLREVHHRWPQGALAPSLPELCAPLHPLYPLKLCSNCNNAKRLQHVAVIVSVIELLTLACMYNYQQTVTKSNVPRPLCSLWPLPSVNAGAATVTLSTSYVRYCHPVVFMQLLCIF